MSSKLIERDSYFDTLKGFLIIAVIVGNTIELANPSEVNVHYFILFLYMFHMPLFTFVSGYFSKKSKRTTVEKVKHTFLLYIFAQLFYVAYSNFVLNASYELTLLSTHWTFWYLLSLTFLYIISDYIKNEKAWLIGSIIFSILIGFDTSVGAIGSFSRTFFFLPFFICGLMFKREYVSYLKKRIIKMIIPSIIILIILYILNPIIPIDLLFEYTNYKDFINLGLLPMFVRIFHYIGAFILGGLILTLIPEKKYYISSIGKSSLYMYLVHAGTVHTIFPYLKFNTILNIILSGIATIFSCILISKAFMYSSKFFKFANSEFKKTCKIKN